MLHSYAVIPAAGRSARMGACKLLLPVGGRAVIDRVLSAWTASSVTRTIVVVRADDERMIHRCRQFDADLVLLETPTADMKASVLAGLRHIASNYAPADYDACLVAPADLPRLSTALIDRVINAYDTTRPQAVAPRTAAGRGHPVLLPWSHMSRASRLGPHEGLNDLIAQLSLYEVPWDEPAAFDDLDTPGEYVRLAREVGWPTATNL